MQILTICRIVSVFLMLFSLSMLTPIVVDYYYDEAAASVYLFSFAITFGIGFIMWFLTRSYANELKIRDGFLVVVSFWFVLGVFASLPFILSDVYISFTDAIFESISGITTTGATILNEIDVLPMALKYYRQQLQFIGGMGIIVLAVAVLPMLGVGGMQLYRAEMPGPMKENKLTPRITSTAKTLWVIYVGLTLICIGAYALVGLPLFEAVSAGFSTISTGGFFIHENSIAAFDNSAVRTVAIVFMLLGAFSFSLHFIAFQKRRLSVYWQDEEFRVFILILGVFIGVCTVTLYANTTSSNFFQAFSDSVFTVVSLVTTTGHTVEAFSAWPLFLPIFIMAGGLIGGCAGSTSGGVKVLRVLLLQKQAKRELHRLLHPQAVITLTYDKKVFPYYVLQAIWAFIGAFIACFFILVFILMALGLDLTTAYGASVATLANTGAAIGDVSRNYHALTPVTKWVLVVAMLAGRLEIFTLLILFTPVFWRK